MSGACPVTIRPYPTSSPASTDRAMIPCAVEATFLQRGVQDV